MSFVVGFKIFVQATICKLSLIKCEFWLSEIKFWGHIISKNRASVDPGKIELGTSGRDRAICSKFGVS